MNRLSMLAAASFVGAALLLSACGGNEKGKMMQPKPQEQQTTAPESQSAPAAPTESAPAAPTSGENS